MVTVNVTGNKATSEYGEWLTSGTVGAKCRINFDEAWDGLSRTAVFIAGNIVKDVIIDDEIITIPWEVLQYPNLDLLVGVYGSEDGGMLVIPTVYTSVGRIQPGADPSGDEGTVPTPSVVEQVIAAAGEAITIANEAKDIAEGLRRDIDIKWGSAAQEIPLEHATATDEGWNSILEYIIEPNKQGLFYGHHIVDAPAYNAYMYFQVISRTAPGGSYVGNIIAYSNSNTDSRSFGTWRRRYSSLGWMEDTWTRIYDENHTQPLHKSSAPTAIEFGEESRLHYIGACVDKMNELAQQVRMQRTVFNTPSGRNILTEDDAENRQLNSVTCAYDQLRQLVLAYHNPAAFDGLSSFRSNYDVYGILQEWHPDRDYDVGEIVQVNGGYGFGTWYVRTLRCKVHHMSAASQGAEDWTLWEDVVEPTAPCWRSRSDTNDLITHKSWKDVDGEYDVIAAKGGSTSSGYARDINPNVNNRPKPTSAEQDDIELPETGKTPSHYKGALNYSAIVQRGTKRYAASVVGLYYTADKKEGPEDKWYLENQRDLAWRIINDMLNMYDAGKRGDITPTTLAKYNALPAATKKSQTHEDTSYPHGGIEPQIDKFYCPGIALYEIQPGANLDDDLFELDVAEHALYINRYQQRVAMSTAKMMTACVAGRVLDGTDFISIAPYDRVGGSGRPYGDYNVMSVKNAITECLAVSDNALATAIAANAGKKILDDSGADIVAAATAYEPFAVSKIDGAFVGDPNATSRYYSNLKIATMSLSCRSTDVITAGGTQALFSIYASNKTYILPRRIVPMSVRCAYDTDAYINSDGIIALRPHVDIPANTDIYITGFWMT